MEKLFKREETATLESDRFQIVVDLMSRSVYKSLTLDSTAGAIHFSEKFLTAIDKSKILKELNILISEDVKKFNDLKVAIKVISNLAPSEECLTKGGYPTIETFLEKNFVDSEKFLHYLLEIGSRIINNKHKYISL